MTMIMGYLPRLEQHRMHGLSKWWYYIGVGRVQVSLPLPKLFFFPAEKDQAIIAVNEKGEYRRLVWKW